MRNLTLRQLRAVQAVSRLGTIAAAARQLSLTAPAVTIQVKQIEDDVGLALFDRTSEGMRLTVAGKAVLASATAIETTLRSLAEEIDSIKGVRSGTINLGVVSTAKYFAPRLIAAFRGAYPKIEVKLKVGNRHDIVSGLKDYKLDLALMGRAPTEFPVDAVCFGDHPLVIIADPAHPLAGERDIEPERLLAETIIIREPGSGTRLALEGLFINDLDRLQACSVEMGSNETIKQAVMAGLGIAFISAHTIAFEVEMGRLRVLDVRQMPIRRKWYAVCRQERIPAPAERAFKAFLLERGATHLPLVEQLYPAGAMHGAPESGMR
ncbi:LysR substrate-binding domain-containing protein [Jiella sp. MQZ9-1]|uniref:HTH-type transcriptional regulator CbbR n=1 Tax=Jiella flava TaxID=2816857 RepID=A0A939FX87_9HYPH|nr:LysR family transcriptional regulator [Jiella flava]MBO0663668.1 LysR family transcriptional regulator [Jiella flava]MCD2472241.1 LysR substrate-binding domain-containing protein [Jiella flava]